MPDPEPDGGDAGADLEHEVLLGDLRRVAEQLDPCPPDVLTAARAAFDLRTLDAELAELVADSRLAEPEDAAVLRAPTAPAETRLLRFAVPADIEVELEVLPTPAGRRLVGQVIGGPRGPLTIEHSGGPQTVEVDALGRFTGDVPCGHLRLRLRLGDRLVVTSWVTV